MSFFSFYESCTIYFVWQRNTFRRNRYLFFIIQQKVYCVHTLCCVYDITQVLRRDLPSTIRLPKLLRHYRNFSNYNNRPWPNGFLAPVESEGCRRDEKINILFWKHFVFKENAIIHGCKPKSVRWSAPIRFSNKAIKCKNQLTGLWWVYIINTTQCKQVKKKREDHGDGCIEF